MFGVRILCAGDPQYHARYDLDAGSCEHPAMAAWLKAGLEMVTVLDGSSPDAVALASHPA